MKTTPEKSLRELLSITSAELGDSPIGRRLDELFDTPVSALTDAQLAFCLRQRRGATYLAPLALLRLKNDLWCDGGLYAGHLVIALARNLGRFGHLTEMEADVQAVLELATARVDELDAIDRDTFLKELKQSGLDGA